MCIEVTTLAMSYCCQYGGEYHISNKGLMVVMLRWGSKMLLKTLKDISDKSAFQEIGKWAK